MDDDTVLVVGGIALAAYLLRDTAKPIGDAVEAVADTASGIGSGVSNATQGVGSGIGTIGKEIGETVEAVVNPFQEASKAVSGFIKNTSDRIANIGRQSDESSLRGKPAPLVITPASIPQAEQFKQEIKQSVQQGYGTTFTMVNQALGLPNIGSAVSPAVKQVSSSLRNRSGSKVVVNPLPKTATATDRRVTASKSFIGSKYTAGSLRR